MKLKKFVFIFIVLYFSAACTKNTSPAPTFTGTTPLPQTTQVPTQTEIAPITPAIPTEATQPSIPTVLNPGPLVADPDKARNTRSLIATRAAELAADTMPGDYSWEQFRTCSTFVSAYLRQLSFPVNGIEDQYANYPDPFPWSGTVEQVNWVRRNYPEYIYDAPVIDFLEGRLWDRLMPGDVITFQTAVGHNGYNTYYHTVILVSYQPDGSPLFAELAEGMWNVSTVRTFEQMTAFYARDANNQWKVDPVQKDPSIASTPLLVTWFDPLAIINKGHLWQQPGPVAPNSNLVSSNFDDLITINIYDGTAVIWEQAGGVWSPVTLEGRNEFYSVIGRLLPANNTIAQSFLKNRKSEIYDGDFGVYYSEYGVFQNTWTPQMIARLTGFENLKNFGGLNGDTLTSLMIPQMYDKSGGLKDNWDYSSFTFHRIPDVVNQDMLLRVDLLKASNTPGSSNFGPIPVPTLYLSSGCINFDETTWAVIQTYLQNRLDAGHRVGVIFSYPNFDQNLLPTNDLFKSAFTGGEFNKWCPVDNDKCDGLDRRDYRLTYLDE